MKTRIVKNIRLKLLALGFATALWFFVAGQSKTEVGFLVPLGFKGMPKDMAMVSTPPGEVEVRVIGPKLFINNLSPSQIIAEVDLNGARAGLNSYRLKPDSIITPMGIDVIRLRPSSIDIRLERLRKMELPVKARLTGRPAPGYRIAGITVSPGFIEASGIREIKDLNAVYTKAIDVSGLADSVSVTAPLDISGNEFRSISADKAVIKITIEKER